MILINNLKAHSSAVRTHVEQGLTRVLDRGWFVLGPEVGAFEEEFAAYVGLAKSVSLANGTDAIELALRAVGIKENDMVATVANAGMYTSTALLAIGAEPFYLDVDLKFRVVTLAEVQRAITAGVKAVVVTHLYGLAAAEIVRIAELCRDNKIPLIEDCAQAHGARVNGKMAGSFGDIACFSFYPTKNLGALGDGGAIATDNLELAALVAQLRQYGWASKYEVVLSGARNSRLDEMQAAILREFLPLLDLWNQRRREIAQLYAQSIKHQDVELPRFNGEDYVGHLYVVKSSRRDSLRNHLKQRNIASEVHYPIPDYKQPVFKNKYHDFHLVNTEDLTAKILTLPCYPEMTDEEVNLVAEAVNAWEA